MARRMIDDTAREAVDKIAYNKETHTLDVGTNLGVDGRITVAYDNNNKPIKLDGADIDNDGNINTYTSFWKVTLDNSGDPHVLEFRTDGIYLDDVKITN